MFGACGVVPSGCAADADVISHLENQSGAVVRGGLTFRGGAVVAATVDVNGKVFQIVGSADFVCCQRIVVVDATDAGMFLSPCPVCG